MISRSAHQPQDHPFSSHYAHYELLNFLQIRVPLFPIEAYLALTSATKATEHSLSLDNPQVQRALAVGSRALVNELQRHVPSAREHLRRERTLLRYFIRMSTRPTPYGLFAGVALAHWAEKTDLKLADSAYSVHARPDMGWLLAIIEKLEATPEVRKYLYLVSNTAVYKRKSRFFLQDAPPISGTVPESAFSLKATDAVIHALRLARRPISYPDLVQGLLSSVPGATLIRVEKLVSSLWKHAFLISDLRLPPGADAPARALSDRLATIPPAAWLREYLEDYLDALTAWENAPATASARCYEMLAIQAESIKLLVEQHFGSLSTRSINTAGRIDESQPKELKSSTSIRVDATLHLSARQVARSLGEEIASAAELMLRFGNISEKFYIVRRYRQRFLEKYGTEREIPLLELTDTHFGQGILDSPVTRTAFHSQDNEISCSPVRAQELLSIALSALHTRQRVVQLNNDQQKRLEIRPVTPETTPTSMDVYAFVIASSVEAVNHGDYLIAPGPRGGTSQAGQSLGRFASLLGDEAKLALAELKESERLLTPGTILAEMAHVPRDGRMSNLITCPPIHNYQLLYGMTTGSTGLESIPLDELVVGVRNERFYVRWPRHGRDLSLCLRHMFHSYWDPEVIKFLSMLAEYQAAPLSHFSWEMYHDFPFLPRLQIGRTLLSFARWNIYSPLHMQAFDLTSPENFISSLARWREYWDVPRYVYLSQENAVEREKRLLLDLTNPVHAEEVRAFLRLYPEQKVRPFLEEAIPGPEHAWLQGPGGHYLAEFVVSLARKTTEPTEDGQAQPEKNTPLSSSSSLTDLDAMRFHAPGSEWLFVKLYCSPILQDDLITDSIWTFVHNMREKDLITEWFFVRYIDPDPHIRLRFHGDAQVLLHKLLPDICRWANLLMTKGYCTKFSFDTYEREIERYGGSQGMLAAETLFSADSIAVVDMLHLFRQQQLDLNIYLLAIYSINDLLASLNLSLPLRSRCFSRSITRQKATGKIYRLQNSQMRALLGDPHYLRQRRGGTELAEILASRRERLGGSAQQLSDLFNQGMEEERLWKIYRNFVHMHCNRLLGMDGRAEQMILELLLRTWTSLEQAPLLP